MFLSLQYSWLVRNKEEIKKVFFISYSRLEINNKLKISYLFRIVA